MRKIIFLMVVCLCWVSMAEAEVIYLKDGTVLRGEITQKTPYYTTVKTGKYPKKIFNDEIDHIDEDMDIQLGGAATSIIEQNDITELKATLILSFMEANGTRGDVEENVAQVIDKIPAENRAQAEVLFNVDEILAELIPVYAKYYSEEDLTKLIDFYKSELGQKVLEVSPNLVTEVVQTTLTYFQKKLGQ